MFRPRRALDKRRVRSSTELDAPKNAELRMALDGLELTDGATEIFPSRKHGRAAAACNQGAGQDR